MTLRRHNRILREVTWTSPPVRSTVLACQNRDAFIVPHEAHAMLLTTLPFAWMHSPFASLQSYCDVQYHSSGTPLCMCHTYHRMAIISSRYPKPRSSLGTHLPVYSLLLGTATFTHNTSICCLCAIYMNGNRFPNASLCRLFATVIHVFFRVAQPTCHLCIMTIIYLQLFVLYYSAVSRG